MNKLFDLHNDFLTEIKRDGQKNKYLKDRKNIANDIISAVWTSKLDIEEAMDKVEKSYDFIKNYNIKQDTKRLLLGIEDLHFISKNNLAKIINIKPTYCSLTWNNDNLLAGGALEGGDLTNLGIDVIRELEQNNIQIDTAHLSEKSFMRFGAITEHPILCSHTAVNYCRDHKRNLKDYQIKMIVESSGLVGISLVGDFLTAEKRSSVSDVARHIDYIVSRFGDDNICLGTDFYGTKNLPKGINTYKNLSLLEERLKIIGYTQETINKIFYKNAKRFFK